MSNRKNAAIDKFNARMEQAEARIDMLKAKAEEADADARLRLNEEIDDIRSRKDSLKKKMHELQTASDEAWQDLKAGAEAGWRALSNAVDRATSRYS